MSAHSTIVGGSTAGRLITCPGSARIIAALPDTAEAPSYYAAEGTVLHEIMASYLGSVEADLLDAIGIYDADGHTVTVDEQLIRDTLDGCMSFIETEIADTSIFCIEERFAFPGIHDAFGTCDLVTLGNDRIVIVDWKFGSGVQVVAEEPDGTYNSQLAFYACAARAAYPDEFRAVKIIDAYIVQPRAQRAEGEPIWTRTTFTHEDLDDFEEILAVAVGKSHFDDAPLKMSKHCRFCPAKLACPEFNGPLLDMKDFDTVGPALATSADETNPAYPDMLRAALDLAPRLEMFVSEARRHAQLWLAAGNELDGWKLVPKRATRKWRDDAEADVELHRLGLTTDEVYTAKIISPAQAEKALKRVRRKLPDGLAIAESSGVTLAREGDPRPEATSSLALLEDFSAAMDAFNE